MQGVQTLQNGVVWRVGNGQSINIWEDPWIPRDLSRLPITPRGRTLITKADKLIDPFSEQWDVALIQQVFGNEDAKIIRSIPIHTDIEDSVGWHFDVKGSFSVKSAYKVQRAYEINNHRRSVLAGTGSSNGGLDFWKRLWRLDCPPKVKHFLWRMSHNTLALKRNLKHRGVKTDTLCSICSRLDENGGHLFFQVQRSQDYLAGTKLGRYSVQINGSRVSKRCHGINPEPTRERAA